MDNPPTSVVSILSDRRGGLRHDTVTIVSCVHAWRGNPFIFHALTIQTATGQSHVHIHCAQCSLASSEVRFFAADKRRCTRIGAVLGSNRHHTIDAPAR